MISVLMSVYNESEYEIQQSIDSILAQTYTDFELIIILDQPNYSAGLELLREYSVKDSRVHIYVNNNNIGLALSMNRAAEYAKGEYLLRMDADDICFPNRFKLQYDAIRSGAYDLVCGNYDFIDEKGELLQQIPSVYSDRQLDALLPYRNVIHHPTVIMTAELFHKVGGYRNYPCAQDYDLWLRMKCIGAKMHMMSEKLIQYRVRQKSTTVSKRYKQYCTCEYIRMLYHAKNSMIGYSYENYLGYLDKRHVSDLNANQDFLKNMNQFLQVKQKIKSGHILRGIADFANVLFCSRYYRPHILRILKISYIKKFVK